MHLLKLTKGVDVMRLYAFLCDVRVSVRIVDNADSLEVSIPGARTRLHERLELQSYIGTWNALNPAQPVEVALAAPSSRG